VSRVLQPYLDGHADDMTSRRVQGHLDECRRCGLEADTYRAISDALARHEPPTDEAVARLRAFGETLLRPPPGRRSS
jgi:anti-sigma factor RsiW